MGHRCPSIRRHGPGKRRLPPPDIGCTTDDKAPVSDRQAPRALLEWSDSGREDASAFGTQPMRSEGKACTAWSALVATSPEAFSF